MLHAPMLYEQAVCCEPDMTPSGCRSRYPKLHGHGQSLRNAPASVGVSVSAQPSESVPPLSARQALLAGRRVNAELSAQHLIYDDNDTRSDYCALALHWPMVAVLTLLDSSV